MSDVKNKIEQCKKDIEALKENLKKLQDADKYGWIDSIGPGSLVCSCNETVYMLCETGTGYVFTHVSGQLSKASGRISGKLYGEFKTLQEAKDRVRSAARLYDEIKLCNKNITLV